MNTHKVKWDLLCQCYVVVGIKAWCFIGETVAFRGSEEDCEIEANRLNDELN